MKVLMLDSSDQIWKNLYITFYQQLEPESHLKFKGMDFFAEFEKWIISTTVCMSCDCMTSCDASLYFESDEDVVMFMLEWK